MGVIDKSSRKYMSGFIKRICDEVGPRRSASEEERKAQEIIKSECENFADDVKFDEFTCAYNAYPQGLVRVASGFITLSILTLMFVFYWLTIVFSLVALWVLVAELMVMLEFTDPFYKKDTSHNVFGVIKPTGEVKYRVIFGGHSDSAYEIPFARKYGKKISILMFGAIGYGLIALGIAIVKLVLDMVTAFSSVNIQIDLWQWGMIRLTWLDFIYYLISIVGYPYLMWIVHNAGSRKTVVPGANDNLSGVAVALALGQYFKDHKPRNVEIWCGSFGCEEAGQRGSKRFVQKYGVEEGVLDNAYGIVLESLSGMGFAMLDAEKMYLTWPGLKPVHHSKECCDKFYKAMEKYDNSRKGVPYFTRYEATFAGTDATRFSQKGFKATALVSGGANEFIDNWHDKSDTPENIKKIMLWHAANICVTFVENLDKEFSG
ncbi:MAG: M28 family peptidase [Promethearchaeota archaeon]